MDYLFTKKLSCQPLKYFPPTISTHTAMLQIQTFTAFTANEVLALRVALAQKPDKVTGQDVSIEIKYDGIKRNSDKPSRSVR